MSYQETRCTEFAEATGLEILGYFGSLELPDNRLNCPGFQKMVRFLRARKKTTERECLVLVLKERSISSSDEDLLRVQKALSKVGGVLSTVPQSADGPELWSDPLN